MKGHEKSINVISQKIIFQNFIQAVFSWWMNDLRVQEKGESHWTYSCSLEGGQVGDVSGAAGIGRPLV